MYDAATGRHIVLLPGHHVSGKALAISPDGSVIVTGDPHGTLRVWDTNAWETLPRDALAGLSRP